MAYQNTQKSAELKRALAPDDEERVTRQLRVKSLFRQTKLGAGASQPPETKPSSEARLAFRPGAYQRI